MAGLIQLFLKLVHEFRVIACTLRLVPQTECLLHRVYIDPWAKRHYIGRRRNLAISNGFVLDIATISELKFVTFEKLGNTV